MAKEEKNTDVGMSGESGGINSGSEGESEDLRVDDGPADKPECEGESENLSGDEAPADKPEGEQTQVKDSGEPSVQTRVKRVGLAALILSMGIMCSRLLGYVREAVIAYQAGAGAETDAYNAAFLLPDMMNHFLAGGTLSITFIPLFAGYLSKNEPKRAERLFSLIATTMGTLLVAAIILCWSFATPLAQLLFPGFSPEQIANTVSMTRIILPGQFFHYMGGLMMAVLMAQGQFLPSAMAPLIYNLLIIICGLVLGGTLGMQGFAIGALLGAVLGPFLLPLVFLKSRLRYRPVFGFGDRDFKKYIFLTLPLMIGASLTTVDEWVGKFLGSNMEAGSISWLNYARRLVLVPIAIVGQAAGQAALPYLSQLSARGEFDTAAATLHKTLRNVVILSLIMVGFFVILAEPMVSIVYERGAFSAEDTAKTAMILRILAISIVFWTIQMVSVRAFYAAQNTLTPMILTTIVTLISLPVYYFLSQWMGLPGLALASCIGMAMQASSIVIFYHRRNVHFKPLKIVRAMGTGIVFGLIAAAGSYGGLWLVRQIQMESHLWKVLLELGIPGCIGVCLVCIFARFLIPEEFMGFLSKIRRRLPGRLKR
ncbi:MAG: murein biosynthesis integral membrane protein MurJ [Proteobacteria bacterium]|nr:murein biosynthesis integral membrane protein MurJ [Pseudomonadota bacterium]